MCSLFIFGNDWAWSVGVVVECKAGMLVVKTLKGGIRSFPARCLTFSIKKG